jgi:nucleotide-binding universal stress UspA family protein
MFQRALICTDFTDGLHRLTHCVPDLAASGLSQITFLHVIPISEEREIPKIDQEKVAQARDRLQAGINSVPEGVTVKVDVRVGKAADNILKVAQSTNSDLLVLGMPTRSLLTEKLFGSTTLSLCQRNARPVLILRPQLISAYTREELALRCRHLNRYFLIPYNASDTSEALVKSLKQYAQHRPPNSLERCLLCWVLEKTSGRSLPPKYSDESAAAKLAEVKQDLEQIGLSVTTELRHGEPIMEVMEAALEHDISSIAVTVNQNWLRWSVRGFTEEIMRSSWHPVLYLPTES